MKILFIGDIFGSPGRKMIKKHLPQIVQSYGIDLVIANAENSAHGKGITPKIYDELIGLGIFCLTMGNHTWNKQEGLDVLDKPEVIRPLNLNPEWNNFKYGVGSREFIFKNIKVRVTNLLGNSINFSFKSTNAFVTMKNLLESIDKPDLHIVDFHAETTAEKYSFLWAFNGQVDAILGTHTHVPTNDAIVTNLNTAFICDVGMTGPAAGIIGANKESAINKCFNPTLPFVLDVAQGSKQLSSVILDYDEINKKIISITPFIIKEPEEFKYIGKSYINEKQFI